MEMEIVYDGIKKVNAIYNGYTVRTDQPKEKGGEATAPAPFDLFLSSIGTCAGFYVFSFCKEREIPTDGIELTLRTEKNEETGMIGKISIEIKLPSGFPEKYNKAVIRAADQCAVKKHIFNPPEFAIHTKTI